MRKGGNERETREGGNLEGERRRRWELWAAKAQRRGSYMAGGRGGWADWRLSSESQLGNRRDGVSRAGGGGALVV